jgi:hypothetical protein
MDIKRTNQTEKMPGTEPEHAKPVYQKGSKIWKRTLAVEWFWFACTLLGSWLLSNILEFYVPAGVGLLTIILFILVYLTRLTVWAIKQMGKE